MGCVCADEMAAMRGGGILRVLMVWDAIGHTGPVSSLMAANHPRVIHDRVIGSGIERGLSMPPGVYGGQVSEFL